MEVTLSRQQFEALLKAVYMADWMVNAICEPGDEVRELVELKQYLWSLAHRVGLTDVVEFEPRLSQFVATNEFEEALQPSIDDYDDRVFWDGLVDRLADRDFVGEYGDAVERMDRDERFTKFQAFVDKYESEVDQHGVDRLRVSEA